MKRDGVTFVSCVPSFFESVLHDAPADASLDHLALGGEAFTGEFRSEIARHVAVARITNLYGPTETTIDAVSHRVVGDEPGPVIPIGRPMAELPGLCSRRVVLSRCRPVWSASFTSRALVWRAAI